MLSIPLLAPPSRVYAIRSEWLFALLQWEKSSHAFKYRTTSVVRGPYITILLPFGPASQGRRGFRSSSCTVPNFP